MMTADSHLETIRIMNRIIELQRKDTARYYSFRFCAGLIGISRCDITNVLNGESRERVDFDDNNGIAALHSIIDKWEADVNADA